MTASWENLKVNDTSESGSCDAQAASVSLYAEAQGLMAAGSHAIDHGQHTNAEARSMLNGFSIDSSSESSRPRPEAWGVRVGMAWNGADNIKGETPAQTIALHDLVFSGPEAFGLKWDENGISHGYEGLAASFTAASIEQARQYHQKLLAQNPRIELLAELRYRDSPSNYLPAASPWWLRNSDGQIIPGYKGKGLDYDMLDIRNPQFQDHLAEQAAALVKSGAVDGVMLDWFNDGQTSGPQWEQARVELLQKIRKAIGPDAKIYINTNDKQMPPEIAKYVNGYYMESNKSDTPQDWQNITDDLDRAEAQGKTPFLETWPDKGSGREELNKMRATVTLQMTHAPDGYSLFADADGTSKQEHLHDWYPFYDTKIGAPVGPLEVVDGASLRQYQNGVVVYNPMGNKPFTVEFPQPHTSAATGKTGETFAVSPEDGDIFLSSNK